MKISFVMPGYAWVPSGGYKIVYEYASRLTARGHEVSVVHPLKLEHESQTPFNVRRLIAELRGLVSTPAVDWVAIHPSVEMLYVPTTSSRFIPDADIVFATAWNTVDAVMRYPASKGKKCYFIQHYETWSGPKDEVDATWRAPLSKVVVSQWLLSVAQQLGVDAVYIPNGLDQGQYPLRTPLTERRRRVAMMFSSVPFKRAQDGIEALCAARECFGDLAAVLFGAERRKSWIPEWIEYHYNPEQAKIANIYNTSSIFLSSSWAEGFALPPAEAASCGCAIVATDSGGIRDYVTHGVTGLLSPPCDAKALADNLCTLLQDDELRITLARQAHDEVRKFIWSRSISQMEAFVAGTTNYSRVTPAPHPSSLTGVSAENEF